MTYLKGLNLNIPKGLANRFPLVLFRLPYFSIVFIPEVNKG